MESSHTIACSGTPSKDGRSYLYLSFSPQDRSISRGVISREATFSHWKSPGISHEHLSSRPLNVKRRPGLRSKSCCIRQKSERKQLCKHKHLCEHKHLCVTQSTSTLQKSCCIRQKSERTPLRRRPYVIQPKIMLTTCHDYHVVKELLTNELEWVRLYWFHWFAVRNCLCMWQFYVLCNDF